MRSNSSRPGAWRQREQDAGTDRYRGERPGFGYWAIGGEWATPGGQPLGWGKVDDDEECDYEPSGGPSTSA